jgi:hypothetical protein
MSLLKSTISYETPRPREHHARISLVLISRAAPGTVGILVASEFRHVPNRARTRRICPQPAAPRRTKPAETRQATADPAGNPEGVAFAQQWKAFFVSITADGAVYRGHARIAALSCRSSSCAAAQAEPRSRVPRRATCFGGRRRLTGRTASTSSSTPTSPRASGHSPWPGFRDCKDPRTTAERAARALRSPLPHARARQLDARVGSRRLGWVAAECE